MVKLGQLFPTPLGDIHVKRAESDKITSIQELTQEQVTLALETKTLTLIK